MKKAALFFVVAIIMIASIANAGDFKLDFHGVLGTHFNADYTVDDKIQSLNITREKSEWYLEVETGTTYNIMRPFIGYREQNEIYNFLELGVDVKPLKNIPVGIRTSWQKTDLEGIGTAKQGFVGIVIDY